MSSLEHKKIYDSAKAHDYYMRTRELKGRKKGTVQVPKKKPKRSAQAAKIKKLRARAEKSKARLAKKIQNLLEQVEGKNPIPENANPALRKLILSLRKKTKGMIKEGGAAETQKIATDLKTAIAKARQRAKN